MAFIIIYDYSNCVSRFIMSTFVFEGELTLFALIVMKL